MCGYALTHDKSFKLATSIKQNRLRSLKSINQRSLFDLLEVWKHINYKAFTNIIKQESQYTQYQNSCLLMEKNPYSDTNAPSGNLGCILGLPGFIFDRVGAFHTISFILLLLP